MANTSTERNGSAAQIQDGIPVRVDCRGELGVTIERLQKVLRRPLPPQIRAKVQATLEQVKGLA